jgi:hypothetical protein
MISKNEGRHHDCHYCCHQRRRCHHNRRRHLHPLANVLSDGVGGGFKGGSVGGALTGASTTLVVIAWGRERLTNANTAARRQVHSLAAAIKLRVGGRGGGSAWSEY